MLNIKDVSNVRKFYYFQLHFMQKRLGNFGTPKKGLLDKINQGLLHSGESYFLSSSFSLWSWMESHYLMYYCQRFKDVSTRRMVVDDRKDGIFMKWILIFLLFSAIQG